MLEVQILGEPGAGKTTAAMVILAALRAAGLSAILVDDDSEADAQPRQEARLTALRRTYRHTNPIAVATVVRRRPR